MVKSSSIFVAFSENTNFTTVLNQKNSEILLSLTLQVLDNGDDDTMSKGNGNNKKMFKIANTSYFMKSKLSNIYFLV
jgi:predicted transport protein